MAEWKLLTVKEVPKFSQINTRWDTLCLDGDWTKFWKTTWSGWGLLHSRLIIWRILQHGYFTNVCEAWWDVYTNECPCCQQPGKSITHLFYNWDRLHTRRAILVGITKGTKLESMYEDTLLGSIKQAVRRQWRNPTQLILIAEIFHATWTELSMAARQRGCYTFTFPLDHVILHALLQIKDLQDYTVSPKKMEILENSRDLIRTLLVQYLALTNRQLGD